ncbi:MAG: hypothetical protein M1839_003006 [Geoglossum umbratile]|nr:MAG: hypothetical protein M1839_003006 [Geoglossum umbratile]
MTPITQPDHGEDRRPVPTPDTQEPSRQGNAQPLCEQAGPEAVPLPEVGAQEQLGKESTTLERIAEEQEQVEGVPLPEADIQEQLGEEYTTPKTAEEEEPVEGVPLPEADIQEPLAEESTTPEITAEGDEQAEGGQSPAGDKQEFTLNQSVELVAGPNIAKRVKSLEKPAPINQLPTSSPAPASGWLGSRLFNLFSRGSPQSTNPTEPAEIAKGEAGEPVATVGPDAVNTLVTEAADTTLVNETADTTSAAAARDATLVAEVTDTTSVAEAADINGQGGGLDPSSSNKVPVGKPGLRGRPGRKRRGKVPTPSNSKLRIGLRSQADTMRSTLDVDIRSRWTSFEPESYMQDPNAISNILVKLPERAIQIRDGNNQTIQRKLGLQAVDRIMDISSSIGSIESLLQLRDQVKSLSNANPVSGMISDKDLVHDFALHNSNQHNISTRYDKIISIGQDNSNVEGAVENLRIRFRCNCIMLNELWEEELEAMDNDCSVPRKRPRRPPGVTKKSELKDTIVKLLWPHRSIYLARENFNRWRKIAKVLAPLVGKFGQGILALIADITLDMAPILAETVEAFHPNIGVWAHLVEKNLLPSITGREPLRVKLPLEYLNEDELRTQLQSPHFQSHTILEPTTATLSSAATSPTSQDSEVQVSDREMALDSPCRGAVTRREKLTQRKRKRTTEESNGEPSDHDIAGSSANTPRDGPRSRFVGVVIRSSKRTRLGN